MGTWKVISFPSKALPVAVPITEATMMGLKVWIAKSPSMISRENKTPARGALKEAAIPAAAPQPTKTLTRSLDKWKRFPNAEPTADPICTVGPSRPAEPPEPMVKADVVEQVIRVRLRIFPAFNATACMTRWTPFSFTASGKKWQIIPVKIPPNMGMSGKRKGNAVPVIPSRDNPSEEKTLPKNSIIHRKAVEAKPDTKPIKAARISILWSCIR